MLPNPCKFSVVGFKFIFKIVAGAIMSIARILFSNLKSDSTVNLNGTNSLLEVQATQASKCVRTQNSTSIQSFVTSFVRGNLKSVTSQIVKNETLSIDTDISKVEQGLNRSKKRKKKFLKKGRKTPDQLPAYHDQISEESPKDDIAPNGKKALRPNYFIAVQVLNPKVLENAKKVQTNIFKNSAVDLRHMAVDIRKSHITLMAMHLSDSLAIKRAADCLDQCLPVFQQASNYGSVTLDIEGLSVFNDGSVVFASVKPTAGLEALHSMADVVIKQMKESGIMASGKGFNPHMTLMKYKWKKRAGKCAKKVGKTAYAELENEVFGSQTISSVQLCSMMAVRDDGYYVVEHEVFLNDK